MSVDIDPAWALAVYFIAVRVGVLLIMTPIFASLNGLITVRVLFTLALSVVLVAGMGKLPAAPAPALGPIIVATMAELVMGATLAFGVFAAFGAFSVAGKILDIQSGFGIGSVYDPVTRAGAPLFATLLNLAAVAVFFALDAHHALMRGIAFSLQQVPPGAGFQGIAIDAMIGQFGLMFSFGVALIVPVMLCLLLTEAGLAVISRVLPQMNVFIIGMPVKIVVGLAILAVTVRAMGPTMGRVYASIFIFWEQVLS